MPPYPTVRPSARFSLPATFGLAALLVTSLAVPACGGGDDDAAPAVHNRLWITKIPKGAKDEFGLLAIAKVGSRKQYGKLYRGSLVRGSFELFEWIPEEGGRAHMRLLQDDRSVKIRTEKCEPDAGYHLCVVVHGDPLGEVRYQSRKYWGLPARAGALDLAELRELAEDDADLSAALAGAEDMSEAP